MMKQEVIDWLLEPDNPSVKHRTLVELMGKNNEDSQVQVIKHRIIDSQPVKKLLDTMHPDGYWLQKNPRTGEILGDEVVYGAFGTTHYCLSYLADLGLNKSNVQVKKAADRYLNLQKKDGDFYRHLSCLLGYNIRTYIMLGYRDDPKLQRSIDLLLNTSRPDGGYL